MTITGTETEDYFVPPLQLQAGLRITGHRLIARVKETWAQFQADRACGNPLEAGDAAFWLMDLANGVWIELEPEAVWARCHGRPEPRSERHYPVPDGYVRVRFFNGTSLNGDELRS